MADNVVVTAGSGTSIAADEVVDGVLGTVKAQFVKLMDGTLDSTNKLVIDSSGRVTVLRPTHNGKTVSYLAINTATSGDNTLIAAAGAGIKSKIIGYVIVVTSAITVQFKTGATNLSGPMALGANGGISVWSHTDSPVFETAANTAFLLNLNAATQVSGHIAYFQE